MHISNLKPQWTLPWWPFTLAFVLLLSLVAGCAGPDLSRYADQKPVLDLKQYFNGEIKGWGMVQNRGGQVDRRFVVTIKASWNGDEGTLDEYFDWSDGEKQRRIWKLKAVGPNRYIGTAEDVNGQAIGEISGNALRWRYSLNVPFRGSTIDLDFDDWMILIDDRVMLNRAAFSKWGIRMGEVTLSFSK
ncbi:MAG: DUF3833 domain-containing protein [Burkholderiaceae bacterium]|nr:DUF3833 domain-containing protein [Burkholderiaceae bacterium]